MAEIYTPEDLLAALVSKGTPQMEVVAVRQTVTVIAGGAGTIEYAVPDGKNVTHLAPVFITSTYYDILITLALLLEPSGEGEYSPTPIPVPLTGAITVALGAAVVQAVGMRLTITNASANPATLTLAATLAQMPRDYARDVYLPMLREMRQRAEALVPRPLAAEVIISRFPPLAPVRLAMPSPAALPKIITPITGPVVAGRPRAWEEMRRRFPPVGPSREEILRRVAPRGG